MQRRIHPKKEPEREARRRRRETAIPLQETGKNNQFSINLSAISTVQHQAKGNFVEPVYENTPAAKAKSMLIPTQQTGGVTIETTDEISIIFPNILYQIWKLRKLLKKLVRIEGWKQEEARLKSKERYFRILKTVMGT